MTTWGFDHRYDLVVKGHQCQIHLKQNTVPTRSQVLHSTVEALRSSIGLNIHYQDSHSDIENLKYPAHPFTSPL